MLDIKGINFSYKKKSPVLNEINVQITPGFTLLIGENGSGKSTLLQVIVGILPTRDKITLNGEPLETVLNQHKVAYLPQVFDVYPVLPIKEILRFIAKLKGISAKHIDHEISRVVEQTNIQQFLKIKFKNCSTGIQRRVGIASALLGNPEVVILDEPTAGVDPKERIAFYKIVGNCFQNKIVIISTHILDDIELLADSVIMLSSGKITYFGEYINFKHSLDEKLYQLICAPNELDAVSSEYAVLSCENKDDRIYCRVVDESKTACHKCKYKINNIEATTEDLWIYYQQVKKA